MDESLKNAGIAEQREKIFQILGLSADKYIRYDCGK
jgi:hypothetical protein